MLALLVDVLGGIRLAQELAEEVAERVKGLVAVPLDGTRRAVGRPRP